MPEPMTYGRAVAILDSVMGDDWQGINPDPLLQYEAASFFLGSGRVLEQATRYTECALDVVLAWDAAHTPEETEAWTDEDEMPEAECGG